MGLNKLNIISKDDLLSTFQSDVQNELWVNKYIP